MSRHYVLKASLDEIIEDTDAPENIVDHLEELDPGTYTIRIEED